MSEPKPAGAGRPCGGGGGRPVALPRLRLTHRQDGFLVTLDSDGGDGAPVGGRTGAPVPTAAPKSAFKPFRLPKVPKSVADQLVLFGDLVWRRYRRCVAALLLVSPANRRWCFRVPAQRCGRAASCWSASAPDEDAHRPAGGGVKMPPTLLLAGSYQTRCLAGGEAPDDAPPPHDGLHLVHLVHLVAAATARGGPGPNAVSAFLTAGGRMRAVAAGEVILDDLEAGLEECLPRLTFD